MRFKSKENLNRMHAQQRSMLTGNSSSNIFEKISDGDVISPKQSFFIPIGSDGDYQCFLETDIFTVQSRDRAKVVAVSQDERIVEIFKKDFHKFELFEISARVECCQRSDGTSAPWMKGTVEMTRPLKIKFDDDLPLAFQSSFQIMRRTKGDFHIGEEVEYCNRVKKWHQGKVIELHPFMIIQNTSGTKFHREPEQLRKRKRHINFKETKYFRNENPSPSDLNKPSSTDETSYEDNDEDKKLYKENDADEMVYAKNDEYEGYGVEKSDEFPDMLAPSSSTTTVVTTEEETVEENAVEEENANEEENTKEEEKGKDQEGDIEEGGQKANTEEEEDEFMCGMAKETSIIVIVLLLLIFFMGIYCCLSNKEKIIHVKMIDEEGKYCGGSIEFKIGKILFTYPGEIKAPETFTEAMINVTKRPEGYDECKVSLTEHDATITFLCTKSITVDKDHVSKDETSSSRETKKKSKREQFKTRKK